MKILNKMIEQKLSIPFCNPFEKLQEENEEEYEIIKEDYNSSPKCGTKSHFVKNMYNNNIPFSPAEISTKPYFKYTITLINEEQKNDMPSNITNNNSLLQKKQINVKNKNFGKKVENEENNEGKEMQEKKNLNLVKIAKMNNEIKKKKGNINMQLKSSNY